jgi:hypothetical protein
METETLALAQEIDFSFWALFARATLANKLVLIILIVASLWAWAIIIQKLHRLPPCAGRGGGLRGGLLVGRAAGRALRAGRRDRQGRPSASSPPGWSNGAGRTATTAG